MMSSDKGGMVGGCRVRLLWTCEVLVLVISRCSSIVPGSTVCVYAVLIKGATVFGRRVQVVSSQIATVKSTFLAGPRYSRKTDS